MLDGAKEDASKFRADLVPVMGDLASARDHLAHALHIDRAIAKIQRELAKK